MATGTVPAVPAAAPAASAAPAAAPAAPSTGVGTGSGAGPAGGAGTGSAAPVTTGAPGAGTGTGAGAGSGAPQGEPKASDYPNTHDGQMQFMQARKDYKRQQAAAGQPGQPAAQPAGQPAPKPAPTAEEQQAAKGPTAEPAAPGGEQPVDPGKAQPGQADADVTPKALADMMGETPELKALFDAKPEVKGKLFSMARKLASAEPVLDLVPTRADAEFHTGNSAALVTLKAASMRAGEDPSQVGGALDLFDQQFAVVGQDGKPVMGADGKPTYAADRQVFIDGLVNREMGGLRSRFKSEIDGLRQRLGVSDAQLEQLSVADPKTLTPDQRKLANLNYAMTAMDVMEQLRSGEFFESGLPQLPADASEEMKAWFAGEQQKLKDQREALDADKRGASKEQRAAERKTFNGQVRADMGGVAGKIIGEQIKQALEAGVYIPQFYLQQMHRDKNGQETKTTEIAVRIFEEFERELNKPGSRNFLTIAEHSLLPTNDQTRAMRKEWYQARAAEMIPGLVQKEIDRINGLVKADQTEMEKRAQRRTELVHPEPITGGSSLPQGATEAQIRQQAETNAAKLPEWNQASPSDKQAMILTQYHRLKRPRG